MSWTAPFEWTTGYVVTAAKLNEQLYYNMRYLKGLDGVVTVESGLVIDNTGGDEYLKLPLLTTAEAGTVLNAEGEVAFDEQTHRVKIYDNDGIESLVSTADVDDTPANGATTDPVSSNWAYDHVDAADPHSGYMLESVIDAAGDIIYGSGDNAIARLAGGAQGRYLRMGAAIPEWATADISEDFFAEFNHTTGTEGILGPYHVIILDAGAEQALVNIHMPSGFSSLTSAKIWYIGGTAAGTVDWTVNTNFATDTEAYGVHTDSVTADGLDTENATVNTLDISAAFTGVAAEDVVGIELKLDAVGDAGKINVLGVRIKYS